MVMPARTTTKNSACKCKNEILALRTYTNKDVAELTGLGKNTIKEIDKQRLQKLYIIDGEKLIKPVH